MTHHSIAKKQGPKEGNSVRRVTRLAACLTAVSTLGAGLIMPITAVADDATPAVQTTTTSANDGHRKSLRTTPFVNRSTDVQSHRFL